MKRFTSYLRTLKHELRGNKRLVVFGIAAVYIVISVYMINRSIIFNTIFGNFPSEYKTAVLKSLLIDSWSMFQPFEAVLLIFIAILMGINMTLMIRTLQDMKSKKGVKFSFGGSSMVAVVSAGCPSCGISLLSMVGVSTPLLPFSGIPMQLLSLTLLSGSLVYMLWKMQQPDACEVPSKTKLHKLHTSHR